MQTVSEEDPPLHEESVAPPHSLDMAIESRVSFENKLFFKLSILLYFVFDSLPIAEHAGTLHSVFGLLLCALWAKNKQILVP